ncbi:hypothetical protein ACM26W_06505 [Halomonas sp. HK25]|uniref:hypothetical protein n=1 Tax=Halomonas sp. HK25 TaxID=3394321 RepID=UPI0039FBA8E6
MKKQDLLGFFQTKINLIQLSYASLILWSHEDMPAFFEELHDELGKEIKVFPDAVSLIKDKASMRIAAEELYQSSYRSAVKELFPLIKLYCHQTRQLENLKSQPWFQFWRILRNCWSHDMIFNLNPDEKSKLPITWSGVTLDKSINGKPLTHGVCSYQKLYELIQAGQKYVQQELG